MLYEVITLIINKKNALLVEYFQSRTFRRYKKANQKYCLFPNEFFETKRNGKRKMRNEERILFCEEK